MANFGILLVFNSIAVAKKVETNDKHMSTEQSMKLSSLTKNQWKPYCNSPTMMALNLVLITLWVFNHLSTEHTVAAHQTHQISVMQTKDKQCLIYHLVILSAENEFRIKYSGWKYQLK